MGWPCTSIIASPPISAAPRDPPSAPSSDRRRSALQHTPSFRHRVNRTLSSCNVNCLLSARLSNSPVLRTLLPFYLEKQFPRTWIAQTWGFARSGRTKKEGWFLGLSLPLREGKKERREIPSLTLAYPTQGLSTGLFPSLISGSALAAFHTIILGAQRDFVWLQTRSISPHVHQGIRHKRRPSAHKDPAWVVPQYSCQKDLLLQGCALP